MQAAEAGGRHLELVAVNHWDLAVETHSRNHPSSNHICASVDSINPRQAVPGGRLDLLWASPECTHHSRARGGKPMSDQSRATAWCVLRWVEALEIETIMLENVCEFVEWGPTYPMDHAEEKLRGRPIPGEKGKFFRNFLRNLRCLGYTVEHRELICANYGDATTRKRFFLQAKKGKNKRLRWPLATHQPPMSGCLDLDTCLQNWRAAREIIDWQLKGKSIFGRKKPLADKTIDRILAGLRKFNDLEFVIGQQSGSVARGVDEPLPTVAGAGAISLTQPCMVVFRGNCDARSLDVPVPAICTSPGHFGLMQPYLIEYHGGKDHAKRVKDLRNPMPTMDTSNRFGVCEPFLIGAGGTSGQQVPQSLSEPMGTVLSMDRRCLVEPFLVSYYGTGHPCDVGEPLDTISTKDRFGLAQPLMIEGEELRLDILFRMLAPHELAAAHSFPSNYRFAGTRDEVVKQIGNSVPVATAQALCASALGMVA